MITQEELKELFHYDKDSGLFTYTYSRGNKKSGDIAGTVNKDGYVHIKINKKIYKAHRLAWLYEYGYMPDYIDHENHSRCDNRISNLCETTYAENNKNESLPSNNESGVIGVHFRKNRWIAQIGIEDKKIHLGSFLEFSEAVNARKNAEVLYGFHENHGKDKIC